MPGALRRQLVRSGRGEADPVADASWPPPAAAAPPRRPDPNRSAAPALESGKARARALRATGEVNETPGQLVRSGGGEADPVAERLLAAASSRCTAAAARSESIRRAGSWSSVFSTNSPIEEVKSAHDDPLSVS